MMEPKLYIRWVAVVLMALGFSTACQPSQPSLGGGEQTDEGGLVPSAGRRKRQTNPNSDHCQKQKKVCIAKCTAENLPTHTPSGDPFFKCLADCMREAGCRS